MDEEDLEALKDDRKLENTEAFKDGGFAGMREASGDR
jgi:G patch domain-containing protein 1